MRLLIHGRAAGLAFVCGLLLSACAPAAVQTPTATPAFPPIPTLPRAVETPLPAFSSPTPIPTTEANEQVFDSLARALPVLDFEALIPAYIPDDLPLARVALSGQGELRLLYALSSRSPQDSPRLLSLTQTTGGDAVTATTIANPERGALDALAGEVRGQPGYFYWTYVAGGRPSYRLAWQEQNVNITLALTGSWSSAGRANPHSLDALLTRIASGLTIDTGGWQAVTSTGLARSITFTIPPGWAADGANAFKGADGFARLEAFNGPGVTLTRACEWEANAHPERYGPQPEISLVENNPAEDGLCLVRPDSGEAAVLIPSGAGLRPRWHVLRVSARHALAMAHSVTLSADPRPSVEPVVAPTPPAPSSHAAQSFLWQGLTVDKTYLGPMRGASAEVLLTAPTEVLEKRRAAREQPPLAVDQALVNGRTLALVNSAIEHPFIVNGQAQVQVDGQVIYRYHLVSPADARAARLLAGPEGWTLNVGGALVLNGEIVTEPSGHDRVDGWTVLAGKPFYFFQQDGGTRISYNGALFPQVFEQLLENYPHGSNERLVWFYAAQDGRVYYIEIGR